MKFRSKLRFKAFAETLMRSASFML